MRIALVYDAVYPWVRGGGEAHLDELARRLLARGHRVHRVGMKWWNGPPRIEREGLVLHGVAPAWKLYGPT
ncbi:MAG: glycosyltransferase family 1 protein, partial [Oligoflexia bacterium]|nr:glycosyltransferase family 1 protein [Oligoflexia bacterium]